MKPVCNRGLLVNGIFSLYSNCMHAHVATSWKKIVLKILILALRQRHSYLMEMMIYICFVFSARFMTFPTLTLPRESCIPEETILRKHKYRFSLQGHQECGPTSALEDYFSELLMVTCIINLAKTSAS